MLGFEEIVNVSNDTVKSGMGFGGSVKTAIGLGRPVGRPPLIYDLWQRIQTNPNESKRIPQTPQTHYEYLKHHKQAQIPTNIAQIIAL